MELYGIQVTNEPTLRQLERMQIAQKDSETEIGLMVKCIAILKTAEETKSDEDIYNIIYDLKMKDMDALTEFISSVGQEDKKK